MEQKSIVGAFVLITLFSSISTLSLHQMTQSIKGQNVCENIKFGLLPYLPDCAYFIICQNGYARVEECPFDYIFDGSVYSCVPGNRETCELLNTPPPDSSNKCPEIDDPFNLVFLPDPNNCNRYFLCSNGTKLERSCSEGLFWNPEHNWCDLPQNVPNCGSASVPTTTSPTTTLPQMSTTTENSLDCSLWQRCPPNGDTYLPHLTNCSRYFHCLRGIRHLMTCPPGKIFDVKIMQCNDPAVSTCARYVLC